MNAPSLPGNIRADAPILLFDSGVGGLSVLGPVAALLPDAPIVYAADMAGLPYGDKSEMVVATRVCALLGRLTERLGPRLIVIACNTASTIALAHVRAVLEVPVVGTVPAIKPAALATRTGVIGLLGTAATVRQSYVDELEAAFAQGKRLLRAGSGELVAAAERRLRGEDVDPAIFVQAIGALTAQLRPGETIDQIVLGCTHFPLLRLKLAEAVAADPGCAPGCALVDGGDGIARRVAHLLGGQPWPATRGPHRAIFTGDPALHRAYNPAFAARGFGAIEAL